MRDTQLATANGTQSFILHLENNEPATVAPRLSSAHSGRYEYNHTSRPPPIVASTSSKLVFLSSNGINEPSNVARVKSHVAKFAAQRRKLKKANGGDEDATEAREKAPIRPRRDRYQPMSTYLRKSDNDIVYTPLSDSSSDSSSQSVDYPVTLHGSSDPFGTTVVVMDAYANDLLSFNRDYFLPCVNSFERSPHKSASYLNKFYQSSLDAIHDVATANATFARLAAVMTCTLSLDDPRRAALSKYLDKAYSTLRNELVVSGGQGGTHVRAQLFALFSADTLAHNFQAAAYHMTMLQNLLLADLAAQRPLDRILLHACAWHDLVRCMLAPNRPIFRLASFVDMSTNVFDETGRKLIELKMIPKNLWEECYECPKVLRPHLAQFRWLTHVCDACARHPPLSTPEFNAAFAIHATNTMYDVQQIYLDAREQSAVQDGDMAYLETTSIVALASAYWIWADAHFDFLDGTQEQWRITFPSLSPAPRVLGELLRYFEKTRLQSRFCPPTLRLWLLFIASLAEQAVSNFTSFRSPPHRQPCHTAFVKHALYLELDWNGVEETLGRLLYHPRTRPGGRAWFESRAVELQAPR